MALGAGERVGPYVIEGLLGAGGMGEVYRAYDARLERRIALKVLPLELASSSDRALRFAREARAAAALNHPNIVTIHSIEEADGIPFLTMELVEGRTLAEIIPGDGLAPASAVRYAVDIADAISAAHSRGIIHRDLKPSNVMLTPDGRAKVVDFGLAKVRDAATSSEGTTRLGGENLTAAGQFVGTVAYMSPEQLEGGPVDHRSDIFSLGVMLFEMATGRRPFQGDTHVSIIASILRDEPPPITDLRPIHPQGLARIISKALQKDPSRRYQTAADLLTDLRELALESGAQRSGPAAVRRRRLRASPMVMAAAAAAVIVGSFLFINHRRNDNLATTIQRMERLTTDGQAELSAMSSDGRYVVHVKEGSGRPSLWLRQTNTGSDVEIVPPANVIYNVLTLSPDDSYVYFARYPITGGGQSTATLLKVPVLGGQPQPVLSDIDGGVAFSPSGDQLAFVRMVLSGQSHLLIAGADGTGERVVASLDAEKGERYFRINVEPAWSGDGRTILLPAMTKAHTELLAVDVKTGAVSNAGAWADVSAVEWMPDGRSYLVAGKHESDPTSQIWQVEYPSHRARRITNDLSDYVGVGVQADGRVVSTIQRATVSHLAVLDPEKPEPARQITGDRNSDGAFGVAWTRDGRIVFTSSRSGQRALWIMNADGSGARQLSHPRLSPWEPRVTPDGFVIFHGQDAGGHRIWQVGLNGEAAQPISPGPFDIGPVVTDDGTRVYFFRDGTTVVTQRTAATRGEPTPVKQVYAVLAATNDGRLLGVTEPEYQPAIVEATGTLRVLPDLPLVMHPLNHTHNLPVLFAGDGDSLLFPNTREGVANLWLKTAGGERQITRFDRGRIFSFDRSSSGRLVVARGHVQSDVVRLHVE
jgi:serine/threonine protein kinase